MKKITALLIALILAFGTAVFAFAGTADVNSCNVYVTIVDKGEYQVTAMPVGVIDIDGDGALTVNDALYIAHEMFYTGGAEAGYSSAYTAYGLSLIKLWGQYGGVGYYVDNTACRSLADTVKEGSTVVAFVYKDTTSWSDQYTFFDKPIVSADGTEAELTLSSYSYDADWNLVSTPIADAKIDVDFEDSTYVTDENGKVTLPVKAECYYSMHTESTDCVVPALCYMPASAASVTVSDYTAPTCTDKGSAVINEYTITVPAPGHTEAAAVKENEKAPTCTENGSYDNVVYCTVCGEEVSRETVAVEATGHVPAAAVTENETAAEYNKEGSRDNVVYCSVCGAEISRETVKIPAKTGIIEMIRYYANSILNMFKGIIESIKSLIK